VKLLLIGPGREANRRALVDLAERSGVGSRLAFAPPVAPTSVVSSIAGAAAGLALIQPVCRSYELALPNKVFEYLAAGLPVLASDLPVIGPLVSDAELGLVVPPGDPGAIARAMLELTDPVRNAELRRSVAETRGELSWESERQHLTAAHRSALAAAGG